MNPEAQNTPGAAGLAAVLGFAVASGLAVLPERRHVGVPVWLVWRCERLWIVAG